MLLRLSSSLAKRSRTCGSRLSYASQWRWANRAFSSLASPSDADISHFQTLLNDKPGSIITADSDAMEKYSTDITYKYKAKNPSVVLRPETTEQVSSILKYCNDQNIGVVPQGGNTGLVGGSVGLDSEIVLSLEKMNQIHSLDPSSGILKVQSGVILQELQDWAAARNFLVPVDLGAKGTCQIGGTVSTNAGGSYYYRYGSLHANIMGLEVVVADGSVLNLSYDPSHLKDNTGYEMKHLFVGAEGTLGIVTNIALLCPPLPKAKTAAFLACATYDDVCATMALAKSELGEVLAAYEFMDGRILDLVEDHGIPLPLDDKYPYCVLVETHGSNEEHDTAKMEAFVEASMEQEMVIDGVLAQNLGQLEEFWRVRESCNPSAAASGYVYKYDVSLTATDFEDFSNEVEQGLKETLGEETGAICTNWGHVIDGNLHLNVIIPGKMQKDEALYACVDKLVIDTVIARGGSISAEHGLGQFKHKHMTRIKDPATLATMRAVKDLFDPKGIMNPGKYLP
eukprot:Nitzschia sp. Nitz4//scaffold26_size159584//42967//44657//NITZ4_002479-RA/size159584-snap-gene-0.28-mRNA-1//-1//CDS//3329545046//5114//frame0